MLDNFICMFQKKADKYNVRSNLYWHAMKVAYLYRNLANSAVIVFLWHSVTFSLALWICTDWSAQVLEFNPLLWLFVRHLLMNSKNICPWKNQTTVVPAIPLDWFANIDEYVKHTTWTGRREETEDFEKYPCISSSVSPGLVRWK